jgi:hypothetical protein
MRILRELLFMIFLATYLVSGQSIDKNKTRKMKLNSDNTNDIYTFSVASGIGINLIYTPDLTNFITYLSTTGKKIGSINPAFEFFGSAGYRLSPMWSIKLEYSYLFNSMNISNSDYENYENSYSVQMPTVLIQRYLGDKESPFRVGTGLGYRYSTLNNKIVGGYDQNYYSKGIGVKAEAELHTPFGDGLFGYITGDVGMNFMSNYKDKNGNYLLFGQSRKKVSMDFFSAGLKFGLIYYI